MRNLKSQYSTIKGFQKARAFEKLNLSLIKLVLWSTLSLVLKDFTDYIDALWMKYVFLIKSAIRRNWFLLFIIFFQVYRFVNVFFLLKNWYFHKFFSIFKQNWFTLSKERAVTATNIIFFLYMKIIFNIIYIKSFQTRFSFSNFMFD